MTNIILPETATARKLSFFLAMEEFVARQQLADDAFSCGRWSPALFMVVTKCLRMRSILNTVKPMASNCSKERVGVVVYMLIATT